MRSSRMYGGDRAQGRGDRRRRVLVFGTLSSSSSPCKTRFLNWAVPTPPTSPALLPPTNKAWFPPSTIRPHGDGERSRPVHNKKIYSSDGSSSSPFRYQWRWGGRTHRSYSA